jgi:hypothetical protein
VPMYLGEATLERKNKSGITKTIGHSVWVDINPWKTKTLSWLLCKHELMGGLVMKEALGKARLKRALLPWQTYPVVVLLILRCIIGVNIYGSKCDLILCPWLMKENLS